ncbi:hypothetical protein OAA99_03040, partial [Omnitrophica bacterium]|nr:hypothetical protein [Candidatus Omnitrophota bacterium]
MQSPKSQVTSHKSQVTSHKSQVIGHKSQVTSHKSEIRSKENRLVTCDYRLVTLFLLLLFVLTGTAAAEDWKELDSDHFVIYYTQDEKFAKEVTRNAEDYYKDIATDLGYPRYSEFWTWANRVKIYIYPDHASFLKASGQPQWSHGMADYTKKKILSYLWSEMFIDSILPHEIAHLVFRDFVGFTGKIPLWLDEGVAQW